MRFSEAVDNLLDTYNSIDARVVAFIDDSVWKAAFLILRFRSEEENDLKKEHQELLDKIGKIEEKDFCVKLDAFSISSWNSLKEQWGKNAICFESDFAINFDRTNDLNVLVSHPSNYYYNHVDTKWNSYFSETRSLKDVSVPSKIKQYDKIAQSLKFKNIESYISVALSLEEQKLQTEEGFCLILAPVFFTISDPVFDNDSVTIEGKGYADKKISIVIDFFKKRNGSNPYIWKDRIDIPLFVKGSLKISNFSINHPIPNLSLDDGFKVSIYRENGLLLQEGYTQDVGNHWNTKSSLTNPIYPIFKEFVVLDNLKKMLLQSTSTSGKNHSDNFEKAVSWLMSILGLNSIWLGKDFESSGSNEERVVIDILGHNNSNHIFLVNVTTGIPNLSDFARERRFRENIHNKTNNPDLTYTSILFSNGKVTNLIEAAKLESVILLGRDEIEYLLGLIEKGNNDIAREYLTREKITF